MSAFGQIIGKYTKTKTQKPNAKRCLPWFNSTLWDLMKKKDASLKKAFKSGLDTDRLTYKGLRNKVIMQLRKAKAHFFLEIIREAKWNSKILWKSIDQLLGEEKPKSGSIQLKINCIIVNDNPAVATHF